jgi:hypothetical protein
VRPLCIDLYAGLGGWAEGFLAEGYDCVGFDIERHNYGTGGYPGQLVLQDALTLHGSQFRDASCIVASPPCQRYSYMAMPWKRSKALAAWYRESPARLTDLNVLFDACFRIQLEAIQRAGRYIPLVVENVKGAQSWVGRAKAHYGSYYLWGDVEDIGGRIVARGPVRFGMPAVKSIRSRKVLNAYAGSGSWKTEDGKDWRDPENCGVKVSGLSWSGSDKPGYVAKAFNDTAVARLTTATQKQPVWFNDDKRRKCGGDWFDSGEDCSLMRRMSSHSSARKAASAQIAKIPFELAAHIARCFYPHDRREATA